jgi:steroid delta-isomerase-like uncharacterized protein
MAISDELREKREALVREHMDSENRHDYDATIATFHRPRYELIGTGEEYDGVQEVERYFEETRNAFPDQENEIVAIHHSDDAVMVEAWIRGTHLGTYRALPPTGRRWELQILAMFLFEEDRLMCERVYFDAATVLRQLGIARDPTTLAGRVATLFNHPLTIGQAVARQITRQ